MRIDRIMIKTYEPARLTGIKVGVTDYLFEKGHRINKPLIDDLAIYIYNQEDRAVLAQMTTITTTTSTNKGI